MSAFFTSLHKNGLFPATLFDNIALQRAIAIDSIHRLISPCLKPLPTVVNG